MTFADGKSFSELLFAPTEAAEIEEPPTEMDNKPEIKDPDDLDDDEGEDDEEVDPVAYSTCATSAYDDFIVWQTSHHRSSVHPSETHV